VLHASWNAIAKHESRRAALLAGMGLVTVVVSAAGAVVATPPDPASWPWLAASVVVHLGYVTGLVAAYRLGDFNQMYPLARGVAPVLVAAVAIGVLGERLTPSATAGVLVMTVAVVLLAVPPKLGGSRSLPALAAASLTGVTIAGYTLLDGVGVRRSGGAPLGYAVWLMGLEGLLTWLGVVGWQRAAARRAPAPRLPRLRSPESVRLWRRAVPAGLLSLAAYTLVLWAQTRGALAAVAALRESSVVIGAGIGALVFGEPLGRRRMLASVLVAAGVVLLALPG
jgi:drug/metabolite transporter (DMT)-like permease